MTDTEEKPRLSFVRLLPLVVILALLGLVFAMGWHEYLRPRIIADSTDALQAFVRENQVFAVLVFMAIYIVVVALSVPGASILTILSGFLYGWVLAGFSVVLAATIGASIVFLVAKTAIGDF